MTTTEPTTGPAPAPATRPAPEPIRVLLADDQALLRSAFRVLVESEPDMRVVGEAANGAEAVALARATSPDVVLMDIRMPGTDGLAATREISADPDLGDVHVVMLTTFEVDEYVVQSLRAGACGFLGKGAEPEELLSAIRVAAAGDALLSPAATKGLIATFLAQSPRGPHGQAGAAGGGAQGPGGSAPHAERLAGLTGREREVLVHVAAGLSNDEIATRLEVSPLTVKTHVNRAMAKLGARDRAQLVVIAYESGLVRPRVD
ncbi:response regulator transcription factor [Streptomyces fradiae]|uniref:response regulator transcription factor n=1 Tax=Streptomyces fradiae TaxID=1906 RepID=UPI00340B36C2